MPEVKRFDIETWIKTIATGEFHYKDVCGLRKELTPETDNRLRKIMHDLCHSKEPVCEPVGRRDGYYRPIQQLPIPVEWQHLASRIDSGVILPFNLREHVFIYPKTVIVVAGAKSAGKTGFLYRTVVLNMNTKNVVLLSNMEGGAEQLHDRFYSMTDVEMPNPAPFKVYYATDNFHDYIRDPNTLYIIDYIDAPEGSDFYLIGGAITKIARKLDPTSNAIIGLQKPFGRDVAFGGEGTLKDATLYLALNSGKLKIVDAKVAANGRIHPKNMQWSFEYSDAGTRFDNIKPFYGTEEV